MPALGLAPLGVMVIAFVIFSLYWIMLTSGDASIDVGPFSAGLDVVTDPIRDAIRAGTASVLDTLFGFTEGAVTSAFEQGFDALDSGASIWDASINCVIAIFTYFEDSTKAGIRDLINWAYGRDIQNVTHTTETALETLSAANQQVIHDLPLLVYFFGTQTQQLTAVFSAVNDLAQGVIPNIEMLLGGLAAELESAIGGLLGLEGVIVPGIQTEVVNLQGVVAYALGIIALDQPYIDGWITDIPDIKARVIAIEEAIGGAAGAIPFTAEQAAELAALAAIAGLSATAIATLVELAENPCGIVELCSLATAGDSMVEAAALALMLDVV
jgi:hypothetical protein